MPTRLEVLLQSRKSAAAGPFHRHRKASASAGSKPAVTRAANRLGRLDLLGIIRRSYIKSLTISREPAGAVNGQGGFSGDGPPTSRLSRLCLRCDMAKSVTTPT